MNRAVFANHRLSKRLRLQAKVDDEVHPHHPISDASMHREVRFPTPRQTRSSGYDWVSLDDDEDGDDEAVCSSSYSDKAMSSTRNSSRSKRHRVFRPLKTPARSYLAFAMADDTKAWASKTPTQLRDSPMSDLDAEVSIMQRSRAARKDRLAAYKAFSDAQLASSQDNEVVRTKEDALQSASAKVTQWSAAVADMKETYRLNPDLLTVALPPVEKVLITHEATRDDAQSALNLAQEAAKHRGMLADQTKARLAGARQEVLAVSRDISKLMAMFEEELHLLDNEQDPAHP